MLESTYTDIQNNDYVSVKSVQDLIQIANILSSSISKKSQNYAQTHPKDYQKIGFKLYVEPEYEKKIVSNDWPYSSIIGIYFLRDISIRYRESNQSLFLNKIRLPKVKIPFDEEIPLYEEKWFNYPELSPKTLKSGDFYWKKFNKLLSIFYDKLCESLSKEMKNCKIKRFNYTITSANVPCVNLIILG